MLRITASLPLGRLLGLLAAPGLAGLATEVLYNGIRLPAEWPPAAREIDREPQTVPYLRAPPALLPIDVGRQLFVDDFLIEQTTLQRVFHRPIPAAGNPVLQPDRAWEDPDSPTAMAFPFSDGVWFDPKDRRFKMWYIIAASAGVVPHPPPQGFMTAYATSPDGIRWSKPALDVVPGTNIVYPAVRESNVIWLNHDEPDPARRFAQLSTYRSADDTYWATTVNFSPDGLHWSDVAGGTKGLKWFGDRTTAFYNPFRQVWVYSCRNTIRHDPAYLLTRIRHYNEHRDVATGLQHWERHPWLRADRLDPRHPEFPDFDPQLYNLDAVAYESVLLGLFSVLAGPENDVAKTRNIHKRNEIFVAFSRDGYHWDRTNRRPFIGVDETDGAWNWGNVQSAGGCCLIVGDQLYFYYSGRRWSARTGRGPGSTGLAILRRDGFASMEAAGQAGSLTTRPVVFAGRHLFVNADPRGGELRVEVLDQSGKAHAAFNAARSRPLRHDGTRLRVQWEDAPDLSSLAGKPVRFRFLLSQGSLFAFWVSPDETGASRGFVAAGGPEFSGSRDVTAPRP